MHQLNRALIEPICQAALAEDMGSGDATTLAVVPEPLECTALLRTREDCICAGLPVARLLFSLLDPDVCFEALVEEGGRCAAGQPLARVTGKARALLTGERTALNFLQRLCGIATMTRRYVDAIGRHPTKILDTRKTTPGLRLLEKYAVAAGGGTNHRFGLYDRVMIKDNHRALASLAGPGGIRRSVKACREQFPKLEIEVEADTLDDVREAVEAGANIILLDNMTDDELAAAVRIIGGRAYTEASGGITLERLAAVAATGVDSISVGALTHSVRSIDIGLDMALNDAG
ncbi:MAG: carboxylating nicotinate-nucleotide diphosphorylase [Lentisphaeria bacterium]